MIYFRANSAENTDHGQNPGTSGWHDGTSEAGNGEPPVESSDSSTDESIQSNEATGSMLPPQGSPRVQDSDEEESPSRRVAHPSFGWLIPNTYQPSFPSITFHADPPHFRRAVQTSQPRMFPLLQPRMLPNADHGFTLAMFQSGLANRFLLSAALADHRFTIEMIQSGLWTSGLRPPMVHAIRTGTVPQSVAAQVFRQRVLQILENGATVPQQVPQPADVPLLQPAVPQMPQPAAAQTNTCCDCCASFLDLIRRCFSRR